VRIALLRLLLLILVLMLLRLRRHFLSFFLCLSRACLGKMIGFRIEWLKSGVFRTLMVHRL
jgi:hypothetical protein